MSVTTGGSGAELEIDGCRSAREFVLEALEASAAARSPVELAEAYGCNKSHMRNVVSELKGEGEVERVGHGLYEPVDDDGDDGSSILSEGTEAADTDDDVAAEGDDSDTSEASSEGDSAEDEPAEIEVEVEESGSGMSAGTALVGATLGLAAIVILVETGSSSAPDDDQEESVDEAADDADADLGGPEVWG